ncbi:MAG: ABC transporter permease subunit [Chloroflexota bacterium]
MAQISANPPPSSDSSSLLTRILATIFDVRVLGVIGQIAFIVLVVIGFRTIFANFGDNVAKLGEAQFICRDGRFDYRCAYDFMENEAGFDISDPPLEYVNTDSYWYAVYLGFLNTLRVGLLGVVFTTILGTLAGIARLSTNWLISKIALAYVEIIRNTPILIQLFIIYFVVILSLPKVEDAFQLFGFPVFLSNRGLSMPWPEFMSSSAVWIAFLILGIIQFQVTRMYLDRQEERTGKPTNKWGWGIFGFVLIAIIGWMVSGSVADNEALLAPRSSLIREVDGIQKVVVTKSGVNHISEVPLLPEEELDAAILQVCVLRNSASEANFTRQLRSQSVLYEVNRKATPDRATTDLIDGDCDVFAAPKSVLAGELATVEDPTSYRLIPVDELPIVWSIPAFEGFNLIGGFSLSPEMFALLLGLVIFYGGGLAEVVRAGILSVSKGQTEAARALGLNESQRLNLIVLPQALKVIIPPLISTYLSLIKDTSLGLAIGFPDMYLISRTTMNQSGRALQLMIVIMGFYLLVSLVFSLILNWYNNRITLVER